MRAEVSQLEAENTELRSREWYRSKHPDDPIDLAVCKVMQQMHLPIKMEFRRLSPGVYMGDRRVAVTVTNGQVLGMESSFGLRAVPNIIMGCSASRWRVPAATQIFGGSPLPNPGRQIRA